MKIAIIGYGHVGHAMYEMFSNAVIYDEPLKIGSKESVNECYAGFVCVPTPEGENGKCDTSVVEDVISWLDTDIIIIRSTVPVGFTNRMADVYKKKVVFQPEYYGETIVHPFANIRNQNRLSFGGNEEAINMAIEVYKTAINSNVRINMADADAVEFAKYMENAFLATKVVFCNEMYDLAGKLGVNYNVVREIWTSDPRIGTSHTFVYPGNREYG